MVSAFETVSHSTDDAVTIVLQSLLASPDKQAPVREDCVYYTSVISWLKSFPDSDRKMTLLPRGLIYKLTAKYFEIFRMYTRALVSIGSTMCSEAKMVILYAEF